MKSQTLPVKRRAVSKSIFRRLSAVTYNRHQRVAAAASTADMEADDGGSKVSRALIIIFLIHIVAIGLIFIHQRFLDGRTVVTVATAATSKTLTEEVGSSVPAAPPREDLPRLTAGDKPYIVRAGDNYTRIAAAEGVDESKLRLINKHVDIGPGLILKIPPQRIVAVDPPEVTAIREQSVAGHNRGLVEGVPVDVSGAPKARLVRPIGSREASAHVPATTMEASGKSYVVQPGDSVWRIANRFKVGQDKLMLANGISDARKLKTGMKLLIP
jgi:LysM repeat protein